MRGRGFSHHCPIQLSTLCISLTISDQGYTIYAPTPHTPVDAAALPAGILHTPAGGLYTLQSYTIGCPEYIPSQPLLPDIPSGA